MSLFEKIRNHKNRKLYDVTTDFDDFSLLNDNSSQMEESLRNLRISISVSLNGKSGRGVSVLFASSFPQEGKTVSAMALSFSIASPRKTSVFVDADLRKHGATTYLGLDGKAGLSDYLSGNAKLEDIIYPIKNKQNAFVIPCGTRCVRPYELLSSTNMNLLLEDLERKFDYTVFDAPPLRVVSDTYVLAPLVSGVAFVCKHLQSHEEDIRKSIQHLQRFKANVLGIIVSDYSKDKHRK